MQECTTKDGKENEESQNRINFYLKFAKYLNVEVDES